MTPSNDGTAFPPPAAPAPPTPETAFAAGRTDLAPPPPTKRSPKRAVVGIALVAVAALAAAIVFVATRSDDDDGATAARESTLVRFNFETEEVEVLDLTGDVVDSFDHPGASDSGFRSGLAGRVIFDESNDEQLFVLDIASGRSADYDIPESLDLSPYLVADSTHLILDSAPGGDVVTIDLETGDTRSARDELGDESTLISQRRLDGAVTYFDIASTEPSSVVVPSNGDAFWRVPGSVAAIAGDRTLSIVNDQDGAEAGVYVTDSEVGTVDIDGRVVGGLLTGEETALVVTAEGDVTAIDVGDESSDTKSSLDDPVRGALALSADRLFVVGDGSSSYLLGSDGDVIVEFEAFENEDGEAESIEPLPNGARPGAKCFVTQPGTEVIFDAEDARSDDIALRDVSTGEVIANLDASAILLDTPDGCSAATVFDTTADVVLDGELHVFDDYSSVMAVSPDLQHVVVNGGGDKGFALIDVASGDETVLEPGDYAFVAALPEG